MSEPTPFPTPTGPLPRFLLDPEGTIGRGIDALTGLMGQALDVLVWAGPIVLGSAIVLRVAVHWRDRRMSVGGRRLSVIPPPNVDDKSAQVFWTYMLALLRPWWKRILLGQPFAVWEIEGRQEEIGISVWVPASVPPGMVERAVTTAWPGARIIQSAEDESTARGEVAACDLGLARPEWYPLGAGPDDQPIKMALSSLTSLAEDEWAAIQVIAKPAVSSTRRRILKAAAALRGGVKPGRLQSFRGRKTPPGPRPLPDPWIEGEVRAILSKGSSPLFHCMVRAAARAPDRQVARGRIHSLAGAFAMFEGMNGFRRRRSPMAAGRLMRKTMRKPYLLSVPELSLIATLPAAGSVEGVERAGAHPVAPPRAVRSEGRVIGISDKDGDGRREVAITVEDARHHVHIIGETGTGKSTLMCNLVLQDAAAGRSAVVIDPKGDLVEAIIERLPEGVEERTCVLDPTDRKWAVGLDPLGGEDDHLVVDNIVGIFRRIYESYWGPQTDDLMRAICLTLRQIPGATLTEASLFLFDAHWRKEVMWRLRHIPELNTYWGQFDKHHERTRSDMIRPLLNKLRAFDLRGPLRLVVGQAKPKWSLEDLIDEGGLLLVRVPKGTLGEDTSKLFGALVIARLWQACMRRVSLDEDDRPDTALYVDEMHNYLTLPKSFQDLLAEARGYHLALVLAHQHMGQLPRQMKDALGANARTKITFAVSPEDASVLERHFLPELHEYDLSHLAAFQGACRPSVDGGHGRAFTFETKALQEGSKDRAAKVRERSAELFAEPADKIMGHIKERQRNASKILVPPTTPDEGPEGGAHYPDQYGAQYGAQYPAQPRLRVVRDDESPREETE